MDQNETPAVRLIRRLQRRREQARATLVFEHVWPALWPALGVLGAFLCLALLGLPSLLPAVLHLILLAVAAALVGFLLWRGLRGLRRPDDSEADRRLEAASGLRHRPLAVLDDVPAHAAHGGDPLGEALWRAHVARAIAQIGRLRVGLPHPGLAARDPQALRGGVVVALVACLIVAGPDAGSRLMGGLVPRLGLSASAATTQLQAWITPPVYTDLAPVFLKPGGGQVSVPAGSRLTVNVTGSETEPSLALGNQTGTFRRLDATSWQADRELTAGGRLSVRRDGGELAGWDLAVVADRPPVAAWTEPPGPGERGRQQTRLPWETSDDYGVVGLQAEMRLRDRPQAPPLVVTIPLPGGSQKEAHGVSQQDLTANPWAGLPVIAHLVARDAPGLIGTSADAEFELPMRPFRNPIARALIAVRRGLSLHPDDRKTADDGIAAVLEQTDKLADEFGAVITLSATSRLLVGDGSDAAITEAQSRLWSLALHFEEGETERTARALEAARKAAREALDRATQNPTDTNRAELERKLQDLQRAIDQHMQALLDQARREQSELPADENAQRLTERDMQRLAQEAERDAHEGRMDDAQRKMAELERMLDRLRTARASQSPSERRNAEQRQKGHQQVGALQDMVSREGRLLDRSQARAGDGQIDPLTGRPVPSPAPSGDTDADRRQDQAVQQALRRALGELMQQFGDLTGQVPQGLSDADQAMREAGQALGQGHDPPAVGAEQRAIEALQKGGQEMSETLSRQFGPGQGDQFGGEENGGDDGEIGLGDQQGDGSTRSGTQPGTRGHGDRRDPLGREMGQGNSGADEGTDVKVPEEMERDRARAIQDELRRRGADRSRPEEELQYIQRLLRQF
jgi:uncharacterized protein (TIGR02302 family)